MFYRTRTIGPALLMGWLCLSGGFLGLATAIGTPLLSFEVGMGLFVVVAALTAEKEQNLLRVPTAHADSFPVGGMPSSAP